MRHHRPGEKKEVLGAQGPCRSGLLQRARARYCLYPSGLYNNAGLYKYSSDLRGAWGARFAIQRALRRPWVRRLRSPRAENQRDRDSFLVVPF